MLDDVDVRGEMEVCFGWLKLVDSAPLWSTGSPQSSHLRKRRGPMDTYNRAIVPNSKDLVEDGKPQRLCDGRMSYLTFEAVGKARAIHDSRSGPGSVV